MVESKSTYIDTINAIMLKKVKKNVSVQTKKLFISEILLEYLYNIMVHLDF